MRRVLTAVVPLALLAACQAQKSAPTAPAEAPANAAAPAEDRALIVGAWVSNEDPKYALTVTADGKYIETYDGKDETVANYAWVDACEGAADGGPYLQVKEPNLERCFDVAGVDAKALELIYLSRGNVLSFSRVQAKPQ
jgi:hypothetical protein